MLELILTSKPMWSETESPDRMPREGASQAALRLSRGALTVDDHLRTVLMVSSP